MTIAASQPVKFQGVKVKEVSGEPGKIYIRLRLDNEGEADLDRFQIRYPDRIKGDQVAFRVTCNHFWSDGRDFEATWKNITTGLTTHPKSDDIIGSEDRDDYEFAKEVPGLLEKAGIDESITSLVMYAFKPVMERLEAIKNQHRMPDEEQTITILTRGD